MLALLILAVLNGIVAQQVRAQSNNLQSKPAAADASQFVGWETCATCHAEEGKSFEHGRHWKATLPGIPQSKGCESCHGPGKAHVDAGGDPAKIINPAKLPAQQLSKRCLTCHETNTTHANFIRSTHFRNDAGCVDCHSVHKAQVNDKLLKAQTPQLCYRCHAEVKPDFSKPFHHRVNEGLVKCTDCHDPHGSVLTHQVRTAQWQQVTCVACHQDKAGPFQYEHAPVKVEGCTSCHTPHGSANAHLLSKPTTNQLCLDCHSEVLAASLAPRAPTFHNQAQKYQACTLCHVAIHGSNTNAFFFRR